MPVCRARRQGFGGRLPKLPAAAWAQVALPPTGTYRPRPTLVGLHVLDSRVYPLGGYGSAAGFAAGQVSVCLISSRGDATVTLRRLS